MKVSRKIGVGYCCLVALVVVCGAVGWNILGRMTTIVEFISGPAWDTADGCMEFTIELQTQVLAVRDIVDGRDNAEQRQALTEAREGTQEALAQALKHEMVPAELTKQLLAAVENYNDRQTTLLVCQEKLVAAKALAHDRALELKQTLAPAPANRSAHHGRVPAMLASQRTVLKRSSPAQPDKLNSSAPLGNVATVEHLLALPADQARVTLHDSLANEQAALEIVLKNKPNRASYVAALEQYAQAASAAIEARAAQQSALSMHNRAADELLGMMPSIEAKTDGLLDAMVPVIARTKAFSRVAIMVTVIISLFVAVAASLLVTRSIMRPLHAVIAGLKDMAEGEGDLTRRLDENRNDELAELARWFNVFVGKLQGIIQRLAQNSVQLARSSTEVSATSSDLTGVADETKQRSATVAAAAEEMSINMKNMADSTQTMSQSVRMVASSVEELHITINEVAKNAERAHSVAGHAAELAQTSNSMVAQLGQAADGIGKVIEVIQEIAEQTSLLALNATIEAARAGDAGKGFAVVATEVKELAKQTAAATEDIRQRIEGIQTSSRQAIEAIGSIGSVIIDVNEVSRTIASAVEEQSIATKEIAKNVAQTASAAEVVSRSVNESAAASQEITQSITGVDAAAQRALGGASKTRSAGVELEELSQQINGLVAQFQV